MAHMLSDLAVEELKKHLTYDSETGLFTWNKNGKRAGSYKKGGYVSICINKRFYQAHRLAWLYICGEWPNGVIDHINMDKHDNSLKNLRDITQAENLQNSKSHSGSIYGKGVYWYKRCKRWRVKITLNGEIVTSKYFVSIIDARLHAIEVYKKYHKYNPYQGEFNGTDS